jgi:hypothetical protein
MWQVRLTGDEDNQFRAKAVYGDDYFPRRFHYKADALQLKQRLDRRLILCVVERSK